MITAEYLPGCLNYQADWESRNQKDSAEWKICPQVFQKICQKVCQPEIDLFTSRLSNQLPAYYSWKPDPSSLVLDALKQTWSHKHLHAFPPFSLIHRVLRKVDLEKVPSLILIAPTWQSQTWYPELLPLSIGNPLLLPQHSHHLRNPQGEAHTLLQNQRMRLTAWIFTGNICLRKEFQRGFQTLSFHQEERVLSQIIVLPGISGLAGVINRKLIHFDVL